MTKAVQYLAVAIFAIILISIGVWCYRKNDRFVYDPLMQGEKVTLNRNMVNFFESVGADPRYRVNDQRYVLACQQCGRNQPETTPEACHQCNAFTSGVRRYEGTL
jgi:hypothetical protein